MGTTWSSSPAVTTTINNREQWQGGYPLFGRSCGTLTKPPLGNLDGLFAFKIHQANGVRTYAVRTSFAILQAGKLT